MRCSVTVESAAAHRGPGYTSGGQPILLSASADTFLLRQTGGLRTAIERSPCRAGKPAITKRRLTLNKRHLSLAALILAVSVVSATPAFASAKSLPVPVGGNFTDITGGRGTFTGTYNIVQFAVENNQLVAKAILTGSMTDSTGRVLGSVLKEVSVPVTVNRTSISGSKHAAAVKPAATTCDILNLDLGPLDLNLLGLQVDLAQVVLDITAQTGSGNLLGNLLCAVTRLLDGVGTLIDLSNLLNQILQALLNILG
jgi:hypothetical protein